MTALIPVPTSWRLNGRVICFPSASTVVISPFIAASLENSLTPDAREATNVARGIRWRIAAICLGTLVVVFPNPKKPPDDISTILSSLKSKDFIASLIPVMIDPHTALIPSPTLVRLNGIFLPSLSAISPFIIAILENSDTPTANFCTKSDTGMIALIASPSFSISSISLTASIIDPMTPLTVVEKGVLPSEPISNAPPS